MALNVFLAGPVIKKTISEGSKSERQAVVLVVGNKEYVLRQDGGNPLKDPVLDALVGKNIKCEGRILGHCFILSDWEEDCR